jgi:hypothetical protein
MAGYTQFQYGSSQDEDDLIGSENYFEPSRQFPASSFRSYVQNPSPLARNLREEFKGGREIGEENDVEIVEGPIETTRKKRGPIAKKKAPAKRRATKVKVEGEEGEEEGEGDGEKKKNWLDSEVEQLIFMRGEMHTEFEKNAKKQGTLLLLNFFANFFV